MKLFLAFLTILAPFVSSSPNGDGFGGRIKHVIVLMMENRSFDHMLGYLRKNRTDIDGCIPEFADECSNPLNVSKPTDDLVTVSNDAVYIQPGDPGHSVEDTTFQLFGHVSTDTWPPPMNGFIQNYASRDSIDADKGKFIMKGFDRETLPILYTLTDEFTLFDRWFADVPGPTDPNRLFSWIATSGGMTNNNMEYIIPGFQQRSIFQILDEYYPDNNDTWRLYFEQTATPQFLKYTREYRYRWHWIDQLYTDLANGDMPIFTFIDPSYYYVEDYTPTDQHPNHDVTRGEALIKKIYESIRASPIWKDTLFVLTYDEHGGFFDHVPPPLCPNPDGKVANNFDFTRLGIRVPTLLISPWAEKGAVANRPSPTDNQYCHSSIVHTMREQFAPNTEPLTERDSWSLTFEHLLNLETARDDCIQVLPDVPDGMARIHSSLVDGNELVWKRGLSPVSELQKNIALSTSTLCNKTKDVFYHMQNEETLGKFVIECTREAMRF